LYNNIGLVQRTGYSEFLDAYFHSEVTCDEFKLEFGLGLELGIGAVI